MGGNGRKKKASRSLYKYADLLVTESSYCISFEVQYSAHLQNLICSPRFLTSAQIHMDFQLYCEECIISHNIEGA